MADHLVVGALGMDADDHKCVWEFVEGATENHTVVTALWQNFTTRGLTVADGLLVVIDGAKAVRAIWDD
ncbi:hypothetical protein BXT84_01715 [Sulfobacillus thermotolerans]|uniref:Mutator family transposase n=1 Tax=Sulfobacillus thermotolerans TaxID=338644 RepID=A0ABM6RN83_9FIRM|nr:hypothetical protein BXT84_01715 [Sulfobacillus thermotolerans]